MKYGEEIIAKFDVKKDLELWENTCKYDYFVDITLPELTCLCPRSGYPDFASVKISYVPDKKVVELKAIKLYINSFRDRHISHESIASEIFDVLWQALKPKYLELKADFNPRGNVHTIISLNSNQAGLTNYEIKVAR